MRLIDADRFKGKFNTDTGIGIRMRLMIDKQPSAYDVDKVINMLKERAEHAERKATEYDEKGDIPMMDIWDAEEKSYRNAIEIVKSGGVADEK